MSTAKNTNNDFGEQTILVVDDNVANLRVISQCLKESGYRVLTSKDGESALEKAQEACPNLILLDVMMPGIDGFETCRRLKKENTLKKIPVIFMTALTSVEDKVKAFELGAVDYITKPFQVEEVRARVQTHVHLQQLTRRLETQAKELAVAKEQAETANAYKSDFLARMSHEIRTPLNAVSGFTNIVLKTSLTNDQRDYLKKVQLASSDLMDVINDILDFSKVEAGQLGMSIAPFDLDQVLKHGADLFSEQVAQKKLHLAFTVAPEVPKQLKGDAGRLMQVLTNLIGNAVKFTEVGSISVHVGFDETSPKMQDEAVLKISIRDTGMGFSTELLPTLFDPFSQADGSLTRQHDGTGLGLAICKQLVELMKGQIWAESTPGKGSTFYFTATFQTAWDHQEETLNQQDSVSAVQQVSQLTNTRILVVEDRDLNREVAVALLEYMGFKVEAAENGEVAVDMFAQSPEGYYNAVLMDIQMPKMDGYQATRRIRELEEEQRAGQRIPIIALTGHALKGEREKCLAANMDDYLPKPIDEADLSQMLVKWIVV